MHTDTQQAKAILNRGGCTCVLCRDGEVLTSERRGVAPLLSWIRSERDFSGFSAADKVVGNGAAFLYVLLHIRELYAPVMSRAACRTLERFAVPYTCDAVVDAIQNRTGTGICPMEQAVQGASTPQEALAAIERRLQELST